MNKIFEALESMKNRLIDAKFTIDGTTLYSKNKDLDEDYKLLKEAIVELKQIKEAEPSESLELVGYLKDYFLNMIPYQDWLNAIEKYILKAQDQEKALKTIFEKNVDIKGLIESINVEEYNRKYGTYERAIYCRNLGTPHCNKDFGVRGWVGCNKTKLTQEEFDTLKRRKNHTNG